MSVGYTAVEKNTSRTATLTDVFLLVHPVCPRLKLSNAGSMATPSHATYGVDVRKPSGNAEVCARCRRSIHWFDVLPRVQDLTPPPRRSRTLTGVCADSDTPAYRCRNSVQAQAIRVCMHRKDTRSKPGRGHVVCTVACSAPAMPTTSFGLQHIPGARPGRARVWFSCPSATSVAFYCGAGC